MGFWYNISNIGVKPGESSEKLREIHLINQMCFTASFTTFVFAGHMFLAGAYYYIPFQILTGVFTGMFIILNRYRLFRVSIYLAFTALLFNIFYCSLELQGTGVEFFLIPLCLIPFIIEKDRRVFIVLMILGVTVFFISHFLKKTYLSHAQMSPFWTEFTFLMVIFANFMLCGIIIFRFKTVNHTYEKIISEQKKMVEEKNKNIIDSINYARRIQNSLITSEKNMARMLDKLCKKE